MRGGVLLLVLLACNSKPAAPPSPTPAPAQAPPPAKPIAPTIRQTSVDEGYIVVVPKGGDPDAIVKLVHERLGAALLDGNVEILPPKALSATERDVAQSNRSLTPADLDGISAGTKVALGATGEPIATLRALAPIAHDAAVAARGWVLDPSGDGMFTAAAFEKHVPGDIIDVRTQIMIHEIRGDGEDPWLDTMGMHKLGLPELIITVAPTGDMSQLGTLMNAVAQTLVVRPDIHVPGTIDVDLATLPGDWHLDHIKHGGTGRARFRATWHKDEDGDDEIELSPAEGSGTEGFESLVVTCFGADPDVAGEVDSHDPEWQAAAQRARTDLSALRAHFVKGVPYNEELTVKAPFSAADGRIEWMWVAVVRWTGDTLEGTLDNDPVVVKTLKAGARVKVPFAKVADFTRVLPDGKKTHPYSDEYDKKRGSP